MFCRSASVVEALFVFVAFFQKLGRYSMFFNRMPFSAWFVSPFPTVEVDRPAEIEVVIVVGVRTLKEDIETEVVIPAVLIWISLVVVAIYRRRTMEVPRRFDANAIYLTANKGGGRSQ